MNIGLNFLGDVARYAAFFSIDKFINLLTYPTTCVVCSKKYSMFPFSQPNLIRESVLVGVCCKDL